MHAQQAVNDVSPALLRRPPQVRQHRLARGPMTRTLPAAAGVWEKHFDYASDGGGQPAAGDALQGAASQLLLWPAQESAATVCVSKLCC